MTVVISVRRARFYPVPMDRAESFDLERLAAFEHDVSDRLALVEKNPAAVLDAGREVLAFAAIEERLLFPILPLLDPVARAELSIEHEHLADDMQLLESLITGSPESPDVAALASALADRLRAHLARDGRLIAQAVRLARRR